MDNLDTEESINKMNFDLITKGVWEVNQEKTYQCILEKAIAEKHPKVEDFIAKKEEQLENIKQFVMFFSHHDSTYRINAKTWEEEGTFKIENGNQLITKSYADENLQYTILGLNEEQFILDDGSYEIYALDKVKSL